MSSCHGPRTSGSDPKAIETIQLGKFGYGAADPSALVTLRERVVVALSGINQVALIPRERSRISFVTVGRVPERLVRLGDQFVLCLHRCDSRIAILRVAGAEVKLQRMLGEDKHLQRPSSVDSSRFTQPNCRESNGCLATVVMSRTRRRIWSSIRAAMANLIHPRKFRASKMWRTPALGVGAAPR